MWWRFLTFCLLVSFILIIVLNYLHDRPVIRLFFKRCCDDGIENDQEVVFETFSNNYLKERLIAVDIVFDNGTFVPEDVDLQDVIEDLRDKLNVHDPTSRRNVEKFEEEFKGVEDFRDQKADVKEYMQDIETITDKSEISNHSAITETFASDMSDNRNSSDIETKDDVIAITTEKPEIQTIVVT